MELVPGEQFEEKLSGAHTAAEAVAPPPMDALSVIPLGGMGEIGKNCTLIEIEGRRLMVDCGVKFPDEVELPGIDLVIPDFAHVLEEPDRLQALILTHGHEDHIGALPFLLKRLPNTLQVYGSRYTLGLVHAKLEEHRLLGAVDMREIAAGSVLKLGPFTVEAFHVCHSIPDGLGFAIDTPRGLIVHTGDFKFDGTPVDGRKTDMDALRRFAQKGVLVMLSDSTNTENPGETPSEREVQPGLDAAFAAAKGRIITTAFASNVHRFQMVLEAAHRAGRKVATLGMSMTYNMNMAHEMGRLVAPPNTWIAFEELQNLRPDKAVLVTTGSQGEPMSGLSLMASGQHAHVQVKPGDALVYSARIIPGNERTVNRVINDFHTRGADVFMEPRYKVHVSGHGYAGDQRRLLETLRPRYFLPVHGEMRHQVSHRQLAEDAGMPHERVFILDNGERWAFDGRTARIQGRVPSGEVLVDGKGVGDIGDVVLRDRRHLSEDGMVLCVLGLTRKGEVVAGPDIITRGMVLERENAELLEEARGRVRDAVAGMHQVAHSANWDEVRAVVTQVLKKYFKQTLDRRPMVLPFVMELG